MIDRSRYIDWSRTQAHLPVFFQPFWLDTVCDQGTWNVCISEKSGHIDGVLVYYLSQYRRLAVIKMPRLTPYLGIWIPDRASMDTQEIASIHRHLIRQLPPAKFYYQHFHPSQSQSLLMPDLDYSTRYTLTIAQGADPTSTYASLQGNVRNKIQKARSALSINDQGDSSLLYSLMRKTFAHQQEEVPYDPGFLAGIVERSVPRNQGLLQFAWDRQGRCHAGQLLVWDDAFLYNLVLGADPNLRSSGAVQWLLWKAIELAAAKGLTFDFEGSTIPSIFSMFRDFNPHLTPFLEVSKGANYLYKVLAKVSQRNL